MNELERLMRSREGKAHLEEIRTTLKDRTIVDVSFFNEVSHIAVTLHLDGGGKCCLTQPALDVEALREHFAEVLEREYYRDHPKRKPRRQRR